MKISASIYANGEKDVLDTVKELEAHHADLLHIDCKDDLSVFEDVSRVRRCTSLPLDLHLITSKPLEYSAALEVNPVDYLTIQYENLNGSRELPSKGFKKLGLALTSDTPLDAFEEFTDSCDFVLLMATEPGVSGGTFNKQNFRRIREFKRKFPNKRVHVDGGVNAEVSFILRNLGVHCAVSGSYLFKQDSVGGAMLNLKNAEVDSHYRVADFMRDIDETPTVNLSDLTLKNVLQSIEDAKMAFTAVVDKADFLSGIISNADVRKGLLKNIDNLNALHVESLINAKPITVKEDMNVTELLRFVRHQSIPINYLPVTDAEGKLTGSLTFNDLIKGEA
ncbi:MAG: CBS domain-containing protein [Flavobacteriales bacterium]|nr:CBS domain-containing protein [Flavobacteriales bacterium]MCB9191416.1 CBS domain-containing protein [Flavobacteriales bacterium]MCB9203958.1 CBS domain-containing protein [Flavobacteriales bacterium]